MKFIYMFFLMLSPLYVVTIISQIPAFPGAEGFGKFTSGGRGGLVIEVTNLNDSGPGSLRAAIETTGTRTVVFRISGNIKLQSTVRISKGNLTIAGQTAPGDGICIQDYPVVISDNTENVIVRYLRFRMGDVNRQEQDSFWGRNCKNIIIDHCSVSWSIDECSSFYDNENFTMQWCIISESLYHSYHSKGDHGYGGIWGGMGATFHHNLLAHHSSRNPRFQGSRNNSTPENELVDCVNNVIYNWGSNSAYGGENGTQYMRNNYFKSGPATNSGVRSRIVEPYDTAGFWFIDGNFVEGNSSVTNDNWAGVQGDYSNYQKTKKIFSATRQSEISLQSAPDAFESVLENAGANFPKRDSVDERIIEETRTGTATYGGYWGSQKGIIDSQNSVGGWPFLTTGILPTDTDRDGIPDSWEINNGLNPSDPEDRNNTNPNGYTMLEVYLNDIIISGPTSIDGNRNLPANFSLAQNYPNPFNPVTIIQFNLPLQSDENSLFHVIINVYDILGRRIQTLLSDFRTGGNHEIIFDGSDISSGVYFYEIIAQNDFTKTTFRDTRKMILLR